jgi:hypothetical protein|uniref:CMT1A duplicated region transcript 4 protein n=1 Tax=Podoviridae sp. ctrub15 TaxID=2826581 RepID=A0A8S5LUI7_9CAUD|nr:MAG TPA: CMT1A duplicated region transcript 4 protein [Podoviridae sp. ctrub15]
MSETKIVWHPIQLICVRVFDEYGYYKRDDFEYLGLPEQPGTYLVTTTDGGLDFDTFLGDEFSWRSKRQIRAWAVPPEPYNKIIFSKLIVRREKCSVKE